MVLDKRKVRESIFDDISKPKKELKVVKKLITELLSEQFEEAINNFIEQEAAGYDELKASAFFALLENIDKERERSEEYANGAGTSQWNNPNP